MHDPETSFFAVRDAFNSYWEGRPYVKGKGYKAYKRWEWWMESRVSATGQRPDPAVFARAAKDMHRMRSLQGAKSNADWQPLGPTSWTNWSSGYNPGNGRVNCTAVDPTNPAILYCGSPAGGLWKSPDNGQTWAPLFTDLATLGVSGIAIAPTDPAIMYCATGDGDGTDTYSIGVIKSTDGGGTWSPTGLDWHTSASRTTRALRMHPTDPFILFCATSNGLWRTVNGGTDWTLAAEGSFHDVEFKPDEPDIVYACGDRFFRSSDGGQSFDPIDAGLPDDSEVNRMRIAVTPADPLMVYVLCGREDDAGFLGLYRSTDGGSNFTQRSDSPNIFGYEADGSDSAGQSWYDMALCADPDDAEVIYAGGVNVWSSSNGGEDWTIRSHWVYSGFDPYTHADIHSLDIAGGQLLCGSDGGLYASSNGGEDWTDLSNGLQITQFYRLGGSPADASLLIAGAQDNGMNVMSGGAWAHVLGADGMEGAIDPDDPLTMYGESQYGGLNRSDDGGQTFNGISWDIGEEGAWVTPFVIDPQDHETLLAGYSQVYRSNDRGDNWYPISTFSTDETIRALAIAPSDNTVIYCSTPSTMYRTMNDGDDWISVSDGLPENRVMAIAIEPSDPAHVFVCLGGFSEYDKVYESTDAGDSWTNISGNLPNVPVNSIIYQNGTDDGLYVGTDLGVFYKDDNYSNWQPFTSGLPTVQVMELEIHYGTGKLRAATYGRGLWETDLFVPENAPPTAAFIHSNANICAGDAILFHDASLGAAPGWNWSFPGGIPSTSTEQDPQVIYSEAGNYSATLAVSNPFGQDDHAITVPVTVLPNRIDITLQFDDFPGEISWSITDDDGQDVALGGPYSSLEGGSTVEEHVCLDQGCYTFIINDSYGDGLCCNGGSGSYAVTNAELGLVANGAQFDYSESTEFCVSLSVPVAEVDKVQELDVRPLDGEGNYLLSLSDNNGPSDLTVTDAVGRTVVFERWPTGQMNGAVFLSGSAAGVYFARIGHGTRIHVARLVRP